MPRRRRVDAWPWPADTPTDRAQRVALAYREALQKLDPMAAAKLDGRFTELGQRWVVPRPNPYEPNDLLTAEQAADLCNVKPRTLDTWRSRGLQVTTTPDGIRYRVADIYRYRRALRDRRHNATSGDHPR
jgi:hypothetical protein